MRPIHRHIHFDFHTMPGIDDFGRDWDAAAFAQRLADAHVDYINFPAACNIGFSYYETKIGTPYPGMKGDMFKDVLRECHARGIGVTAYINIGIVHELAHRHPDWCRVNSEGSHILFEDKVYRNGFRQMCYNSKEYHNYLLDVIREICAYDIDGLFCDCIAFFPCHCKNCTEDMLHLGIDVNNEEAAKDFSKTVVYKLIKEIKAIVGEDRYFFGNGTPYYEYRDINTHMELESLPSHSLWGYEFLWPTAAIGRTNYDKGIFMTGRFQYGWGDFGGYKGKVSIENDLYDGLCNNLTPCIGDHLHPARLPEKDIYEDIKDIYGRLMQYEPYTEGAKYVADIGVLTTYSRMGNQPTYRGLGRMLAELKRPFNILHVDGDISGYKLLILPDKMRVTEKLAEKLKAHLATGGKILFTGFSALKEDESGFALDELNAEFGGLDTSNSSYFDFVRVPDGSASMSWETYKEAILMKAKDEEDVRAWHVRPYFDQHWDGRHGYFYTPPKERSGYTTAMCNGQIGCIGFQVFDAYYEMALIEHKLLVKQLLDELLPNPIIKVVQGIPSFARVTLTETEQHALLHVKVTHPEPRGATNIVEDHTVLPAGAVVAVRGEYEHACLLPSQTPVTSYVENGYTYVTLGEITGYDMFMLK